MKKLIFLMAILLIWGCSNDEIPIKEEQTVKPTENKIAVGYNEDGSTIYVTPESKEELERRNGKGKKPKVALLTLPVMQSSQAVINVMRDPVEYTGALPVDDNGGFVDWDNDGEVDDYIEYEWRCYFPRSFAKVLVYIDGQGEGQMINNSIAFGATLLGFADVDNDGDQDIIWEGGNHYMYNDGESYSQYNVGINELAEEPTPLADLVSQLQLTESVQNPDYVRWDLGEQYEGYVFHVRILSAQQNDSVANNVQTHTYGEFGLYAPALFQPNVDYTIQFTNVAEDCTPVEVDFSL